METFKFEIKEPKGLCNGNLVKWCKILINQMQVFSPDTKVKSERNGTTFILKVSTEMYKEAYVLKQAYPVLHTNSEIKNRFSFSLPEHNFDWLKDILSLLITEADKTATFNFSTDKNSNLILTLESEIYQPLYLLKTAYPILQNSSIENEAKNEDLHVVEKHFHNLLTEDGVPSTFYIPLNRLKMTTRTKNITQYWDWDFLGDIANSKDKIRRTRNADKGTLAELESILNRFSLSFQNNESYCNKENKEKISDQLFPHYLSIDKALEMHSQGIFLNPLRDVNPLLLIPLKFLDFRKVQTFLINRRGKGDYVGDIVANVNLQRLPAYQHAHNLSLIKIKNLLSQLRLNYGDCGKDWWQDDFEEKSKELFPNQEAVDKFLK